MAKTDERHLRADERFELYVTAGEYGADDTLHTIGQALANYLAMLAPQTNVDEAMSALVAPLIDIAGVRQEDAKDWRYVLSCAPGSGFTEWPIGSLLFEMGAYAHYGIVPYALQKTKSEQHGVREYLHDAVKSLVEFYDRTPLTAWGIPPNNDLRRLVVLTRGRFALDSGEPIEPEALAIFGGVSEGRMRNMVSGQNRTFDLQDGGIPAQQALAWLSERPEYLPSIWEKAEQPEYGVSRENPIEKVVFLPVARDGSVFHPGEARADRYTVGPKGSERQIESFEEALTALQKMPMPYWRRPNEKGNWGIVSGVRWARFDQSELGAIAGTKGFRLPTDRQA